MLLKEHPEDETIINKRVWNKAKTQQGTVLIYDPEDRYPSIDIQWDDGQLSQRCFMMCLEIEMV
jgi:hypothetical protein